MAPPEKIIARKEPRKSRGGLRCSPEVFCQRILSCTGRARCTAVLAQSQWPTLYRQDKAKPQAFLSDLLLQTAPVRCPCVTSAPSFRTPPVRCSRVAFASPWNTITFRGCTRVGQSEARMEPCITSAPSVRRRTLCWYKILNDPAAPPGGPVNRGATLG